MPVVTASLAADHRVSDGHRGALFLRELRELLQRPEELEQMNRCTTSAPSALATLKTIAPEVEADELRGDRPLRNQVDLDSMDWLNFLLGLHEKLKVDIPEADYARLITLDDVVAYLRKQTREPDDPAATCRRRRGKSAHHRLRWSRWDERATRNKERETSRQPRFCLHCAHSSAHARSPKAFDRPTTSTQENS